MTVIIENTGKLGVFNEQIQHTIRSERRERGEKEEKQ